MQLDWHDYKYYPYEKELASREASSLIRYSQLQEVQDGIELRGVIDCAQAARLTYFKQFDDGSGVIPTTQSELERTAQNGRKRQATRYSAHGLHEYKGKFNPQVARAILNIFSLDPSHKVLDPFCGSGTTLVECAHLGINAVGTDVNPFAVFLANAKLSVLSASVDELRKVASCLSDQFLSSRSKSSPKSSYARTEYLKKWFDQHIFDEIEYVRKIIIENSGDLSPIFLAIASNLLRDYSQQDPRDLRIRRRISPLPETSFTVTFLKAIPKIVDKIAAMREVLGEEVSPGRAILSDVSELPSGENAQVFDAAITSPPYAMALPYIDTQRLSLVWLNLLAPDQILKLEATLIGSRELRGPSKRELPEAMAENRDDLPAEEHDLCIKLAASLGQDDGFRRKAVPSLLYRYFASMKKNFASVNTVMKVGAPYALIVGHNHTTIGGVRYDIDTPSHLASLAASTGWCIEELIPLQTYRRYGYHANNAVAFETLMILRKA